MPVKHFKRIKGIKAILMQMCDRGPPYIHCDVTAPLKTNLEAFLVERAFAILHNLAPSPNRMQELPLVTLDTTLGELYDRGSGEVDERRIAMVACVANSEIAPTSRLPRNTKYLYQDSTFSTKPKVTSLEQEKDIQRALAVKYLSLVAQHDAFAAGNMPVILFNVDNSEGNAARGKQEAEKTMRSLTNLQRPSLIFLPDPEHISMAEIEADLLATKTDLDQLEGFPLVVDLDTHYFLNSKAALCTSGLPTYVIMS